MGSHGFMQGSHDVCVDRIWEIGSRKKSMIDDRRVAHVAPNDDTEASMGNLLLYLLGGWSELGEEGPLLESQVHRC